MSMRVCFVTGEYPPMQGGMGDYTRELSRILMEQGVQVAVVTSGRVQDSQPIEVAKIEPLVYARVSAWDWRSWGSIYRLAREWAPQVLHIQYQTAAYGMHPAINFLPRWLSFKRAPFKVAVTFHDLRVPFLFKGAGPMREWVNRELARCADLAIVTNQGDYVKAAEYHTRHPVRLIPIGSNIRPSPPPGYDRAAWREKLAVTEDETLISYFGFLNSSKGGEDLVKAMAILHQKGQAVKLIMVGGQVGDSDPTNVAYLRKIKGLIEALGLGDYVCWTGYTSPEEVTANLLASDLCVLPYRDGASFRRGSLMAALAHGLPVITTTPPGRWRPCPGGLPELVHGENALLVPPGSPGQIAEAVEALVGSANLSTRLGSGASHLAKAFTWDNIARLSVKAYEAIMGQTDPGVP
ncbi:MAG: glycosyltransferase family 4 protein [Chloroflexi bacterium]|nr:glycosyltransferase family 4 protein [Chloroflexota bacterium]